MFELLPSNDLLNISHLSTRIRDAVKSKIEKHFTFRFEAVFFFFLFCFVLFCFCFCFCYVVGLLWFSLVCFFISLIVTNYNRIPRDERMATLSPQKVIVFSRTGVTLHAIRLEFIHYNEPVDDLPLTLTHLTTGDSFNHSVDNLPSTLTHLKTGHQFTQTIVNFHPHSLTSQLS
jgi:hypothetical protein